MLKEVSEMGIKVERIDAQEAAKIRRKSSGFSGYDWAIKSIIANRFIKDEVVVK